MDEAGSRWDGEESLEEFVDGAACGLLSISNEGLIIAVNTTFLDWTGYERRELVRVRSFDELLTTAARIYYETHFSPLLRMQSFVREIAMDVVRRDGSTLPALVNAVAVQRPNGTIARARLAVFGASGRCSYEQELLLARRSSEQAVKAKADFLAMFAHEIRNPLAAVVLEAELLSGSDSPEEHEESITRMRESLARVLRLLNNMLEISKLEAGKVALEHTEFEISELVLVVVHMLRPLAAQKRLAISARLASGLAKRVIGDSVKLEHTLTNLVSNAIKFTDAGSVTVGADRLRAPRGEAAVRFWVRDTGIGIPADRHAQIFEEYEQADASVTRRFGGTGLGLSIARKLVELQGGQLRVESEEGRGSTFSFELRFALPGR